MTNRKRDEAKIRDKLLSLLARCGCLEGVITWDGEDAGCSFLGWDGSPEMEEAPVLAEQWCRLLFPYRWDDRETPAGMIALDWDVETDWWRVTVHTPQNTLTPTNENQ